MKKTALARFRNEEGATATEYVLLLVGIAVAIILGAIFLSNAINNRLSSVGSYVSVAPTN
jgi:Flp pilus assembly pilin Flp